LKQLIGNINTFFTNCAGSYSTEKTEKNSTSVGRMSLLEVACLGNAEKALQGELFFHLRSHNWNVVQEMGYFHKRRKRRNPDFGVFSNFGSEKELKCIVELKHYSANQGRTTKLTRDLEKDFELRRPEVPIIQIGIYTAVTAISPPPIPRDTAGIYRFLNTYCNGTLPTLPLSAAAEFLAWSKDRDRIWLWEPNIGQTRACSFQTQDGRMIGGHLEYIIGIRK
jgi:hypothetical protein